MTVKPSSWADTTFGEVVERLVNGGTPPTNDPKFWGGNTPWVTGADFTPSGIGEIRRFVTPTAIANTSTNVVSQGALLIVTRTGVGKLAIAPCDIAVSQDVTGAYPNQNRVDVNFLYQRMRTGVLDLAKLNQGTSINGIVRRDLVEYPLRLPDLPVQRRIAEILSTVDEAIEGTVKLIAKHQQIKAGLMHDLFTRGLTPDGKLRPPHTERPDLYKDSPLGPIPKEWEHRTVDELLADTANPIRSGPFGSALLKEELVEEGVPLLGIDNVFTERFVDEFQRFVAWQKYQELHRYAVLPGDVIITIMGTVGRCCLVPDELGPALSSKHLWTMTFDTDRVLPVLVCWQLNRAPWVRSWFGKHAQGAVMSAIQSSTLRTLTLPVPKLAEQERMCERYSSITAQIRSEEEQQAKLELVKRGLMHDLLTGEVEVPVAEDPGVTA